MNSSLLSLLLLALLPACVLGGDDVKKCSACRAVAAELVSRLEAEVPRNHLDLRHRLDKEGKRWGKVIDYRMSELRVIHLLDDLCGATKHYELASADLAEGQRAEAFTAREQRRELENYCHDLLERHEEELSEALRGGRVQPDTASDFLCRATAAHCSRALADETAERAASASSDAEAAGDSTQGAAAQSGGQAAGGLHQGGNAAGEAAGGGGEEL